MGRKAKASSSATSNDTDSSSGSSQDVKLHSLLKELHQMVHAVQAERDNSKETIDSVLRTQQVVQKQYKGIAQSQHRTRLKQLFSAARKEADTEMDAIRKALDQIQRIKEYKKSIDIDRPRHMMRRGVLMSKLQQEASTLPLWVGKPGESAPPLTGAVSAEQGYVAPRGAMVAGLVKDVNGDENWILAEVAGYSSSTGKYELDDIDAEEDKKRVSLSRKRVVPLPQRKANPETSSEALFPKGELVLALYPQTTCFYRARILELPTGPQSDYSVLFEDSSYPSGYAPPLSVTQRYVIACEEPVDK